jgi:hypothetical protein
LSEYFFIASSLTTWSPEYFSLFPPLPCASNHCFGCDTRPNARSL